jgi:phosphoribosylanthranilate isomerase
LLDQFTVAHNYRIVCGILVSHKTFLGESKTRMPAEADLPIMSDLIHKKKYLTAIHYCPKDSPPDVAIEDVEEICAMTFPDIVQINCGNPTVIEAIVKALGSTPPEIVFQMNRTILGRFGDSHTAVMEYFKRVSGNNSKHHCLFDMSGGKGRSIPEDGIMWDGKLQLHGELGGLIGKHGLVPGVAGGLNSRNVDACIYEFGRAISVDAESGVRDAEDKLVMDEVNAFYRNACERINS